MHSWSVPMGGLKNGSDLRKPGYPIARFWRKHKNKIMLTILSLSLIVLLYLAIVITVLYVKQNGQNIRIKICESKECLRSAANLALSIDKTADPCEDFYQYSCGNWAEDHPRPATSKSHDWIFFKERKLYTIMSDFLTRNISGLPKPVRQAKDMYTACMDTENLDKLGLKPVMEILKSLTLPPFPRIVNASEDLDYEYSFDWIETVIKIKTMLGMDVLIGFDILADPQNSSVYRLVMGVPETTNPFPSIHSKKKGHKKRKHFILPTTEREFDETFYANDDLPSENKKSDDDDDKLEEIDKLFHLKLMKLFVMESANMKSTTGNEPELDQKLLLAYEEYYSMDEYVQENVDNGNSIETDDSPYVNNLNILQYTVNELQTHTDMIVESNNATAVPIWRRYLEGVFNISDKELDFENDKILLSVWDLKHLSNMASFIAMTPPAKLELYVWFTVIKVIAAHTTTELRLLFQRSYEEMTRSSHTGPAARTLECAITVNDLMGMAVSYAIADPHFVNVTKPKVQTMIHEIKNALSDLVGKAKWMDDKTKLASYQKIIEMKPLIGYPDWLLDDSQLEKYYEGLEMTANTHLLNMISVLHVKFRKTLNKFREKKTTTWIADPTNVNAYHYYEENTITVPLVMMQHPFFDLGLDSLNYGSLGTTIGHEISHGFDDTGRQFDKNGNHLPWWSDETEKSFLNMTQCFIDQFSKFYVPEIDKYVDGENTLGENIADSASVKEALAALQHHLRTHGPEPKLPGFEHMTSEQLFFLSYANSWCAIETEDSLQEQIEDEHPPSKFRVQGALQNNEQFAKAWRCAPGSTMNPRIRCIIF